MLIVRKSVSFRHVPENKGTSDDQTRKPLPAFPARVWNTAAQRVYHHDHARSNQESTNTCTSATKEPECDETPYVSPSWLDQ